MFTGFSQNTIDFMWNIRLNNNKLWFEEHKADFKRDFQIPMKELGQEVYARMTADYGDRGLIHKLSRIYKDARHVRDGNLYRDNLWFSVESKRSAKPYRVRSRRAAVGDFALAERGCYGLTEG